MDITKTFYAPDRLAWRRWLKKHHTTAREIWLVYYQRASGKPRVEYKDALDEALCFGWIDGQVKRVDAKRFAQRFTPRRSESSWSVANTRNYRRLLRHGRVIQAGRRAFAARHRIYDPRAESPIYQIRRAFERRANPAKAKVLSGFFKTGKGEYAEGDRFWGVTVPETRKIVKQYWKVMPLSRIAYLLEVGRHEERLCMVLILVERFQRADPSSSSGQTERKKIFDYYLAHTKRINNWDLVDSSAQYVVGAYLWGKPKKVLERLARSKNLWERRIAIISTFYDIYQHDCRSTLAIADVLLHDTHDLIHKAVGWMLREVGKRCGETTLERFLRPRYRAMPRTMLRYAIERLEETKRQQYLSGTRPFVGHT